QITDRNIDLLDEFKGIRPDQDFYIADKSLVLFFQLYEITPYYMGLQYFPISVYQIQDIIAEEGALGIMAAGD
ncbi:MAG TPA: RsiV family protein, partial [Bacillota bacterium]|nr:RsiV family protein [Bacillota bacterium]